MLKKFVSIYLTILIILFQILTVKSYAAEIEIINLNNLDLFKNRTADEVATEYYKIFKPEYYATDMASDKYPIFKDGKTASISAPYQAGEMNEKVHQSMTDMANYYRWLVGVSKFNTGSSVHREDLQTMAVIEALYFKKTNQLSHNLYKDFIKPDDMDDNFWNIGKNVPHNIATIGYFPQKSIEGFFYEGYNLKRKIFDTIGHRWTLLSQSSTNGFDFAYTNGVIIGSYKNNSSGDGRTDMPIVAFPAPGYNPDRIADGNNTAWSFELGKYKLPKANSAMGISVTVENLQTHETYVASSENGNLICQYESNIVYQQPAPTKGAYYEGSYKITIKGLLDEKNQAKTIEYTSKFIDVSYKGNIIPTSVLYIDFAGLARGLYNYQSNQKAYPLSRQAYHQRTGKPVSAVYVSQTLPNLEITTTTGFKQNISATFESVKDDDSGMTLKLTGYNKTNLDPNINDDLNKLQTYQPVLNNVFFEMVDVNQQADEGKPFTISFKAIYNDYEPVKVNWYKITDDNKVVKVGENRDLTFSKVSPADAGRYFFTAFDNSKGYMIMQYSAVKNLIVKSKTVKSVSLTGFDKLIYLDGNDLELNNVKYNVLYSDGSREEIPVDKSTISGYNSSKIGIQNIVFNYKGKTINKIVTVQAREVLNMEVKSDMLKRTYNQGEKIDPNGFVLHVIYTNSTQDDINVNQDMISAYDKDKVGFQNISVNYRGKSIQYGVTVVENTARALEIFKEEVKKTIDDMKELTTEQKKNTKSAIDKSQNKLEVEGILKQAEKQKQDKLTLEENRVRALALAKKYGAFFDNDIKLARNFEELEEALKDSLHFSAKGIQKFYADREVEIRKIEKQIMELPNLAEDAKITFVKELKATLLSGDLEKALREAEKANNTIEAAIIVPIPVIETENIKKEVIYKGEQLNFSDNVLNLPEGSQIVDVTEPPIDTNIVGNYMAKVKIIFKGGASKIVNIDVEIKDKLYSENNFNFHDKIDNYINEEHSRDINYGANNDNIYYDSYSSSEIVVKNIKPYKSDILANYNSEKKTNFLINRNNQENKDKNKEKIGSEIIQKEKFAKNNVSTDNKNVKLDNTVSDEKLKNYDNYGISLWLFIMLIFVLIFSVILIFFIKNGKKTGSM